MNYLQRLIAEKHYANQTLPKPERLLSENHKTGFSLNLPLINCRPTKRCSEACYACLGPMAWPASIKKALVIDEMLRKDEVEGLIYECRQLQQVRLNGSGDMRLHHVPAMMRLAESCPKTTFWGFTRNRDVTDALNDKLDNLSLIITFDASSPMKELDRFSGRLAFGPRRPEDSVPDDDRLLVVFPEHHLGHTIPDVPPHPQDCPATRGMERHHACLRCQRCWNPDR